MEYEQMEPGREFGNSDNMEQRIKHLTEEGYEIHIGKYLEQAFELFKKEASNFILYTLVILLINGVLGYLGTQIYLFGNIIQMVVLPPLFIGYAHAAHNINREQNFEFNQFFEGFSQFRPLAFAGLLIGILTSIGMFLCLIPGIYLAVAYSFTYFIIWFGKRDDFWEAMEASRKMITEEWFNMFFLALVLALINVAGVLLLGVGLLVSMPVSALAMYFAFDDIVGVSNQ